MPGSQGQGTLHALVMLAALSNGTSLHLCFTLFVTIMLLCFLGCYIYNYFLYKPHYLLYGLFVN